MANGVYGSDTTTIRVPLPIHRALKVVASVRDRTMLDLATGIVSRGVQEEAKGDPELEQAVTAILNGDWPANKGDLAPAGSQNA